MPIDEEVEELERLDRAKEEAYAAVTDWNHLSTLSKVSIVVAAVSGVLSCQLGAVLSQRSFESFSVSCPVAVKDVVKPTGWVSVGLIVVCTIFTSIFRSIAKKNVRSVLNVTQSAAQATATRP
jgi:putative effector of murein hydrolase